MEAFKLWIKARDIVSCRHSREVLEKILMIYFCVPLWSGRIGGDPILRETGLLSLEETWRKDLAITVKKISLSLMNIA